jgi:hypothetical protein
MYATDPQKAKLNVLVGQLRDNGFITTEDLYLAIATRLRNLDAGLVIEEVGGRDEAGGLHWSPLREALLRPEANQLIDWLEAKARQVGLSEGRTAPPSNPDAELDEHGFPKGY